MVASAPHGNRLDQIRAIANRVTRGCGFDLFDVQLRRESIGWVLRVIIDRAVPSAIGTERQGRGREEAVSVAECQRVSEDVSALLEVEDAVDHNYTLEVSSPGLDRPLHHLDDYRRFSGRVAKIVTSEAVDGQTFMAGRITGVEGQVIVIEDGRRLHRIPFSLITRARLEVEF